MVAVILGVLKALAAIPSLVSVFDEFMVWYVSNRVASMKADDAAAIKTALETYDQTPIENAFGSPSAGQVSSDPGAVFSDTPPGGLPK